MDNNINYIHVNLATLGVVLSKTQVEQVTFVVCCSQITLFYCYNSATIFILF